MVCLSGLKTLTSGNPPKNIGNGTNLMLFERTGAVKPLCVLIHIARFLIKRLQKREKSCNFATLVKKRMLRQKRLDEKNIYVKGVCLTL